MKQKKIRQKEGIPVYEDVIGLFQENLKASPEQIGEVKFKMKERVIRAAEGGQDHVLIAVDSLSIGRDKTHPSWWSAIRLVVERYAKEGYEASYAEPVTSMQPLQWKPMPPHIDPHRSGVIRIAWSPQNQKSTLS